MNAKPIAPIVVASLLAGLVIGFYFGGVFGFNKARNEDKAILDMAFPPPPSEIYSLSGTIEGFQGRRINLLIQDVDDYLPHTDGSDKKMSKRYADPLSDTEFVIIDYTILDDSGDPTTTAISIDALVAGDQVIVRSNENIRDAKKFSVTRVERVIY
jgi:hypothetical protein